MNLIGSLFPLGYFALIFFIIGGFFSQDWRGFLLAMATGSVLAVGQVGLLKFGIGIDLATTGQSAVQDTLPGTILTFVVTMIICVVFGLRRLSKIKPNSHDHGADQK
jgi:hypothetical protein